MKKFIILIFFLLFLLIATAKAYIGVSGDFYYHNYTIPIGSEVSGSTVTIHNPSNETIKVRMQYTVKPNTPFVVVNFSDSEFELKPKESKTVYVTIKVLEGCVPGIYDVTVGGEEIVEWTGNESMAVTSAALHAPVKVVGELAFVTIRTVDIYGNPVPCEIRLISLPTKYLVNKTETGVLTAKVAPGKYIAEAYLLGTPLNRTEFDVKAGEHKEIDLVVNTVYFLHFNVVPAVDKEGNIGYAYVTAVVRNLFNPLPNSTLLLKVWFEGEFIENVTVSTIPLLPKGDSEYKYNFIPKEGWKTGTYEFQMLLYSEGKFYAFTDKKQLKVTVFEHPRIATPQDIYPYLKERISAKLQEAGIGRPAAEMLASVAALLIIASPVLIPIIPFVFIRRRKRKELLEKIYRNLVEAESAIKECSEMLKEIGETLRRW